MVNKILQVIKFISKIQIVSIKINNRNQYHFGRFFLSSKYNKNNKLKKESSPVIANPKNTNSVVSPPEPPKKPNNIDANTPSTLIIVI